MSAEKNFIMPSEQDATTRMPGAGVGAGIGLAVLSRDELLLNALDEAVTSDHAIEYCGNEVDLASHVLAGRAGVALLDVEAVNGNVSDIARQLRDQFPDLVLIAAGQHEHQGLLAPLLTAGTVYRFLHKPVSTPRVRQFVEAALRRHDEEHAQVVAATTPPPAVPPLARRRAAARTSNVSMPVWLGGLSVLVAMLALAAWWARKPAPAGVVTQPPSSSTPIAVAPTNNTNLAAQHAQAETLLTQAEVANKAGKSADALRAIESARQLEPDNARAAYLATQVGNAAEREALGKARAALANREFQRALAALDAAAAGNDSAVIAEMRRTILTQQQQDERVRAALKLFEERMRNGALLEPRNGNARDQLESARSIAPRDPDVVRATQIFVARLLSEARTSAVRGDAAATEKLLREAQIAGANSSDTDPIRAQLAKTQSDAKSGETTRLAALVSQRIAQGKLADAGNDNAKALLAQLRDADSGGARFEASRRDYAAALIEQGRAAIQRTDLTTAQRLLREAETSGADAASLASANSELTQGREKLRRATEVVGGNSLKRVRFGEPDYPAAARAGNVSGWVDLEFTVKTDGTTTAIAITNSQPAGVFDQSAANAAAKWKFVPVQRDGVAVEQRAKLRLRFAVE